MTKETKKRYDYVVKYHTFTMSDGSSKQMRFRGKTEKEAEYKLNQAIFEYEHGLLVFNNSTPFAVYAEKWAEDKSRDSVRRMRNHLLPVLGALSLGEIKAYHIREAMKCVQGTSQSNIDKTWIVAASIFRCAVADELLITSPVEKAKIYKPSGSKKIRRAMTEAEEQAFLEVLDKSMSAPPGKQNFLIFGISYACGLRPGEARALTWTNVNLKKAEIYVTQAVKKETKQIGEPKTRAGIRTVPIPSWFLPYLEQYRKETKGVSFLFHTENNPNKPCTEQWFRRTWTLLMRQMQLAAGAKTYRNKIIIKSPDIGDDLTSYCLRHTCCTNWAVLGIPQVQAIKWMGHSDSKMINEVYTHVTQKMNRISVEILNTQNPLLKTDTNTPPNIYRSAL